MKEFWSKLKNFEREEFDSPDNEGSGDQMDKDFLKRLQKARSFAKTEFIISSGFRTPEHNEQVEGVKDSAHLKGLAADIRYNWSSERFKIITALLRAGFNRIGIYNQYVHVDFDQEKPANVMWMTGDSTSDEKF